MQAGLTGWAGDMKKAHHKKPAFAGSFMISDK